MRTSCGAIFWTEDPAGNRGIVLGEEGEDDSQWLPFKGCVEQFETPEQAAIREVFEETCGLVILTSIMLEHCFSTKRKIYMIGLCYVPFEIIQQFEERRKSETRFAYAEKKKLRFFKLDEVLKDPSVHSISKASIQFFWHRLQGKKVVVPALRETLRYQGISKELADSAGDLDAYNDVSELHDSSDLDDEKKTEEKQVIKTVQQLIDAVTKGKEGRLHKPFKQRLPHIQHTRKFEKFEKFDRLDKFETDWKHCSEKKGPSAVYFRKFRTHEMKQSEIE